MMMEESQAQRPRAGGGNEACIEVHHESQPNWLPTASTLAESIVRCTVCRNQINVNFRWHFDAHPKLGVIICKRCLRFLSSGEWTQDSDGADVYCTWCGQGGEIFVCDHCNECGFCKNCLRRNFGRKYLKSVAEQTWACFVCDPAPLKPLQEQCRSFIENLAQRSKKRRESNNGGVVSVFRKAAAMVTSKNEDTTPRELPPPSSVSNTSRQRPRQKAEIQNIKQLPSLLRQTVTWSKEFQSLVENLNNDLTATIECTDVDLDRKLAVSSSVYNALKEAVSSMKDFCNNASERLSGKLCVRIATSDDGDHLYAFVPESTSAVSGNCGEEPPTATGIALVEHIPAKHGTPFHSSMPTKRRRLCFGEGTSSTDSGIPASDNVQMEANDCSDAATTSSMSSPAATAEEPNAIASPEEAKSENALNQPEAVADVQRTETLAINLPEESGTEIVKMPTADIARLSTNDCSSAEAVVGKQSGSDDSVLSGEDYVDAAGSPMKISLSAPEIANSGEKEESARDAFLRELADDFANDPSSKDCACDSNSPLGGEGILFADGKDGPTKDEDMNSPPNDNYLDPSSDSDDPEMAGGYQSPETKSGTKSGTEQKEESARESLLRELADETPPNGDAAGSDSTAGSACADPADDGDHVPTKDEDMNSSDDCSDQSIGRDDSDVEEDGQLRPKSKNYTKSRTEDSEGEEGDAVGISSGSENEQRKSKSKNITSREEGFNPALEKEIEAVKRSLNSKLGSVKSPSAHATPRKNKDGNKAVESSEIDAVSSKDSDSDSYEEPEDDSRNVEDENIQLPAMNSAVVRLERIDSPSARNEVLAALAESSSDWREESSDDEATKGPVSTKENYTRGGLLTTSVCARKPKPAVKPPCFDDVDQNIIVLSSDTDNEENEANAPSKEQLRRERLLRRVGMIRISENEENRRPFKRKGFKKRKRVAIRSSSSSADDDGSSYSQDDVESIEDDETDEDGVDKRARKASRAIKQELSLSQHSAGDSMSSPTKGAHRRNIRPIMSGSLATLEAQAAERDRRKRVAQLEMNNSFTALSSQSSAASLDKAPLIPVAALLLDGDADPPIEVHQKLTSHLKPHQVEGVKFMYRATVESVKRNPNDGPPGGCILAHCMGLGKTLQVIAYLHSVLFHPALKLRTALVVAPVNVVLNWKAEFMKWLNDCPPLEVWELSSAKQEHRLYVIETWQREGGVLIMSYSLFKNLTQGKRIRNASNKEKLSKYLLDPGPDIVVCDEGHQLKNERTAINEMMNRVRTKRRIVLTGTPLQNNLIEYHCMAQFVKPFLLGTLSEFRNRFDNPIKNGQCIDSTPNDVRIMKRRAHILHSILEGCVHRLDYTVLTAVLPPRHEFILMVRLSKKQIELYQSYLNNVVGNLDIESLRARKRLFNDFNVFQRICAHPLTLNLHLEEVERQQSNIVEIEPENVDDVTTSDDADAIDDNGACSSGNGNRQRARSNKSEVSRKSVNTPDRVESPLEQAGWWKNLITEQELSLLKLSGKMLLLMEILWKCEQEGDKVLVFSQSLLTLDAIEHMLENYPSFIETYHGKSDEDILHANKRQAMGWGWEIEADYLRMDGKTNVQTRKKYIKKFNAEKHPRCRMFLISTRAGGVGTNLCGANRVVIFDASWNPSNDTQAIFRAYRFGQSKPVYIYRFVAQGTMEEVIYDRQVTKQSLALRVVDEHQIERHFNANDLADLYKLDSQDVVQRGKAPMAAVPKDHILGDLLLDQKNWLVTYHEHDSLLQNVEDERLTEEEKEMAWKEYKEEREGRRTTVDLSPLMQCVQARPELQAFINHGNMLIRNSGENIPCDMEHICEIALAQNPDWTKDPSLLVRHVADVVKKLEAASIKKQQNQVNQVRHGHTVTANTHAVDLLSRAPLRLGQYSNPFSLFNNRLLTPQHQSQQHRAIFPPYSADRIPTSSSYTRLQAPTTQWQQLPQWQRK